MNRLSMTFIMLAVSGGCMAVDPDPINDSPYGYSQRSSAQSQAWPASTQGGWGSSNGKAVQTASSDWGTRPYTPSTNAPKSWANPPQSTTVSSNNSSSSTSTATAAKSTSSRPVAAKTDKSDDTLVKTSYTETKPVTAKSSAKTPPAEAESPPVNLGMLRLINSKRIIIRYEVKDPASTGVADVEVWGTTDLRSWKKYDMTTRSPSSLVMNVKGEGLYGFTVMARAKGDLTKNQPPQSEPPQMWVAVDLTKPVVQLLGAEMNVMEHTPALVIRWNATDRNLGPRPITLLYAERPEGPWSPIAANLENGGHYEWIMPPCVPGNVCVRVQAADLMGNVGLAQSATLRIPGRSTISTHQTKPALAEPPCLSNALPPISQANIRPIAAREPKPTASILSVDGE